MRWKDTLVASRRVAWSMPEGLVMELSSLLRHKHLARAGRLITHVGRVKSAFTISSLGFCVVHWFISHGFSVHVLPSAVAFGGVTALVVARLPHWLSSRI